MSKEAWMWLANGLGYGAVNTGELLAAYPGGAEAIAEDLGSSALDEILTMKQAEKLAASRPADFALRVAHAETMGVEAVGFDDPRYPALLRGITNPPPVLFVKGDFSILNNQLTVGIVGSRRPSAYGVEAVKEIGRGVALGGAVIVSGLAAGLDAEAHKAALAVNGPTVACIAFGHDTCYPAANKKLKEVIERYGAVISEYPVGTAPEKPFFLQRNRLIAGISHALLVVEARPQSGTMSTVNFASDYGRDVFAVPGSVFSELSGGTNAMIREGAYLAAGPADVLNLYGIELNEEDLAKAAEEQAIEGRPQPAEAKGGLRQIPFGDFVAAPLPEEEGKLFIPMDNLDGPRALDASQARDASWAQDASRAGAAAYAAEDASVGSRQAIDAFRRMQQQSPPTDDSELDARNRALDERVAAVSDSVEIGAAPPKKPKVRDKGAEEGRIRPFSWDNVEHITTRAKKDDADNPPPEKRRPVKPIRYNQTPQKPISFQPIGPVEAIEAVGPVERAWPVQDVEGSQAANPMLRQPREAEEPDPRPAPQGPAAPPPAERVPREERGGPALAGKLRTLQTGPQKEAAPPANTDSFERSRTPAPKPQKRPPSPGIVFDSFAPRPAGAPAISMEEVEAAQQDPLALLSDNAKRAYEQLGPKPVPLAQICNRSGLSSGEAMAALTELELAGLSRQLAGRQFVMTQ